MVTLHDLNYTSSVSLAKMKNMSWNAPRTIGFDILSPQKKLFLIFPRVNTKEFRKWIESFDALTSGILAKPETLEQATFFFFLQTRLHAAWGVPLFQATFSLFIVPLYTSYKNRDALSLRVDCPNYYIIHYERQCLPFFEPFYLFIRPIFAFGAELGPGNSGTVPRISRPRHSRISAP